MADRLPDSLSQVDPVQAWEPASPEGWSRKWAAHLYRRAAFGATPSELREAEKAGLGATLDRLFQGEPQTPARAQLIEDTAHSMARKGDDNALRTWWLYFMQYSVHPLREKL